MAVINSKNPFIFLILILFFLSACEEQVEKGDELSDEARRILRERAALKCINGSNGDMEDFYENSNDKMLKFERGDTWEIKYSEGDSERDTSYLYVWKVEEPVVYFRLLLEEGSSIKNQFIKFDTSVNTDMVLNLQDKGCKREDDRLTIDLGSSNITAKIKYARVTVNSETESETDVTYTFASAYPAFLGLHNRKETKRFYDKDDDDTVTKTDNYSSVIKRISDVDQPATYNHGDIDDREYCVVKYSPATPLNQYAFPFETACVTSDTNGPDANGDGTEDFDPITELVI